MLGMWSMVKEYACKICGIVYTIASGTFPSEFKCVCKSDEFMEVNG